MSDRTVAIIGIGEAPISAPGSGRSPENMTIEATLAACADAGIEPSEVDAVVKYTYDGSISAMALAATLGCAELRYALEVPHGGGSSVALIDVARALVRAGQSRAVLCFRTVLGNEWLRQLATADPIRPYYLDAVNYLRPIGWTGYLHLFAALYQEHARLNGLSKETLFHTATLLRHNAALNQAAVRREPISREEYFAAPRTVGPFSRLDEFAPADVSCAVIVGPPSAGSSEKPTVEIAASAQSHGADPKAWFDLRPFSSSYPESPATVVARQIFMEAGIRPKHVDVAELYDCTTFTPLDLLAQYGLVPIADVPQFVAAGEARVGGLMPINTHGGDFAGGYSHGFRHIIEAVRQLRGTADNQVSDAEVALVAAPQVGPTSAAILRRTE